MKKLIGIGIAAMMVMGLAGAASAATNSWTLLLKTGVMTVNSTTGAQTWSNSQAGTGALQLGIGSAASSGNFGSFTATTAGIYAVDKDPTKWGNKDIRVAGDKSYTWNLKLEAGASWPATAPASVGWSFASANAAPGSLWQIDIYRNGSKVTSYLDDGAYSAVKYKVVGAYDLAAGAKEDWQVVATTVPEPGSIVAMLSGLVGLAGFGIRRRK